MCSRSSQPQSGWSSNVVETGNVTFFTDPGTNPDFTLAVGASVLAGQGSTGADVL
jgi:hypothetical protein